jgi:hypothetical protein
MSNASTKHISKLSPLQCCFWLAACYDVPERELVTCNEHHSDLQEHRIIVYTAAGQKAKPKVHLSMESTNTGNSSKTPEACRRETEEHKLKTAV